MSRQQKLSNEDSKIFREAPAKGLESAIQCNPITIKSLSEKTNSPGAKSYRPTLAVHSDGSIIKNHDQQAGLKQKLVNKVKSWSSKDCRGLQSIDSASLTKPNPKPVNIALDLDSLNLANNTSEDNVYTSDLLKARDSLENLVLARSNKTVSGDAMNSQSFSHSSSSQEKHFSTTGPHSNPSLGSDVTSDSTGKVMTWDPWNKLGRKNKKECKRRKPLEKSPHSSRDNSRTHSPIIKNIEYTAGDDPRSSVTESVSNTNSNVVCPTQELRESYEYQPYRQNKKSVDFVNDVLVVYFTGDEVITKSTEPLKKELDQQTRNKEMRRGHVPCTMLGKRQSSGEDYMAAWFKK